MTRSLVKKLFGLGVAVGVAVGLTSGCYSTKMMEFTYQELDTVKTTQKELLETIHMLSQQLDEERQARVHAQAESAQTMRELREVLEILSYRVDDTSQLLSNRGASGSVGRTVAGRDTVRGRPPGTTDAKTDTSLAATVGEAKESKRLFESSYMDLTLGNYDLAVQGFKNYIVRYPGSTGRDNAYYYLGESYYSLSRYLEAVAEYQSVIREFPRSRFTAASYLKSGFCYQKLEEKQLATKAFRELIASYPRSEEAEQARVALKEMGG
ncbi:MAG: tol-pal system protein YbgF [Candidatus Krumholzibacteria bacterium]